MTVTSTVVWLPLVAVLLYVLIRNNATYNVFLVILFIGLSILFADQMASGICKPYFERFRPTHEPSIMYTVKWLMAIGADFMDSFPAMQPILLLSRFLCRC